MDGLAEYQIKANVAETSTGGIQYSWTVSNKGEKRGLDMFAIEVPAALRIVAFTVPPPYSNPDRTAYWIVEQRYEVLKDPHDDSVVLPAAQPGRKWLRWCGMQSPSVYPPGSSATFSITTDSLVTSGKVRGYAVTYTPRNNPHFYAPFPEEIIGPSGVSDDAGGSLGRKD